MAAKRKTNATLKNIPAEFRIPEDVAERIGDLRPTLDKAATLIARGQRPADTPEREAQFAKRQKIRSGNTVRLPQYDGRERKIGADDILSLRFLSRGLLAARSIARIDIGPLGFGTGFLVAPDLLMTNNHVLATPMIAGQATISFEMFDGGGKLSECREVELDPERFFFTDETLDVTIVALSETPECRERIKDLGWHPMIAQQGKIRVGDPVNIIQHPGGRSKSVVVHNSNLLHLEDGDPQQDDAAALRDPFLWYTTDTERGSSGAPIFNNEWEVVGVHHRSVPKTNERDELIDALGEPIDATDFAANPELAQWTHNEGTRTSRIVSALEQAEFPRTGLTRIRDEVLLLWEESRGRNRGLEAAARTAPGNAATLVPAVMTEAILGTNPVQVGGYTIQITLRPGG